MAGSDESVHGVYETFQPKHSIIVFSLIFRRLIQAVLRASGYPSRVILAGFSWSLPYDVALPSASCFACQTEKRTMPKAWYFVSLVSTEASTIHHHQNNNSLRSHSSKSAMERDRISTGDNAATLEEPLLPPHEQTAETDVLEGGSDGENDLLSVYLVDGLPYKTSLLIKTLYFLDAL